MKETVNFSLALGGGGARGIAHVHVLKAMDDLGIVPIEIASSSIGSIVGAGYASGMSGAAIEEYFLSTFTNRTSALAKLWKARPDGIKSLIWSGENSGSFGQVDIEKILEAFLPEDLPREFSQLGIPLKIAATDYYGNALKILDKGDLRKAIAASAAIPILFIPVIIDDCVLIDGGINNPLPFDILSDNQSYKIAVDVVGLPLGEAGKIPGRLEQGFGASQLMMQSITNVKLENSPPDLFLRPDVDSFKVLDFLKVREILEVTKPIYEETKFGIEKLLNASQSSAAPR